MSRPSRYLWRVVAWRSSSSPVDIKLYDDSCSHSLHRTSVVRITYTINLCEMLTFGISDWLPPEPLPRPAAVDDYHKTSEPRSNIVPPVEHGVGNSCGDWADFLVLLRLLRKKRLCCSRQLAATRSPLHLMIRSRSVVLNLSLGLGRCPSLMLSRRNERIETSHPEGSEVADQ